MLKMVFYDNFFFLSDSSKQKEMVVSPKLMDDSKLFILDIKRELHNNSGRKMIWIWVLVLVLILCYSVCHQMESHLWKLTAKDKIEK